MARNVGKKVVWGLDIASSAIKGVKMRLVGDRPEIIAADIVPLEWVAGAPDPPGRGRHIWQALQCFQEKHDLASAEVVVGLPGGLFFTRPFNVFVVGTRTEEELVRHELEQHIPFGLDAVLWDHESFPSTGPSDRELDGLLFAMKKDVLNNYLLSLSAVEVEPRQIQAAPIALHTFIRYEMNPEEPVLVVDVGAESTTLVAHHGERYWLRTMNIGANVTTDVLQRAFAQQEITREQAETIKLNLPALKRRGEVVELLTPGLRGYVGEIRNGIEHLTKEYRVTFAKIVLVGGGALSSGLSRLLGEELKMRVVTPAGLGRVAVSAHADVGYVNRHLTSFATAIGLGLQGLGLSKTRVNVVGATLMRRRSQTFYHRLGVAGVVLLALFTGLLGSFSTWRRSSLADGTARLKQPLDRLAQRDRLWKKAGQRSLAEVRMDEFTRLAAQRKAWLTVMDKVARMLPENKRPTTPWQDRVWILGLDLSVADVRGESLQGVLEVGTPLREGAMHLSYLDRVIKTPLQEDEHKLFQNVVIEKQQHTSDLRWSSTDGKMKFLLLRLRFDMALETLR